MDAEQRLDREEEERGQDGVDRRDLDLGEEDRLERLGEPLRAEAEGARQRPLRRSVVAFRGLEEDEEADDHAEEDVQEQPPPLRAGVLQLRPVLPQPAGHPLGEGRGVVQAGDERPDVLLLERLPGRLQGVGHLLPQVGQVPHVSAPEGVEKENARRDGRAGHQRQQGRGNPPGRLVRHARRAEPPGRPGQEDVDQEPGEKGGNEVEVEEEEERRRRQGEARGLRAGPEGDGFLDRGRSGGG